MSEQPNRWAHVNDLMMSICVAVAAIGVAFGIATLGVIFVHHAVVPDKLDAPTRVYETTPNPRTLCQAPSPGVARDCAELHR